MHKLSHLVDGAWVEHSGPAHYALDGRSGQNRLLSCVPSGQTEPFTRLATCLEPPYFLLYVLHTPRGEGEAGRYQSSELSTADFRSFMNEFGDFLASDARFDLWVHSPAEKATVVWDRHGELFAYGPLDRFAHELRALGFTEGTLPPIGAHQHHYRHEWDGHAARLLAWWDWHRSPLRPEDEQ